MDLELEVLMPVVDRIKLLKWQELKPPSLIEVFDILDSIFSNEDWIGVRVVPSGPKTVRNLKRKFNSSQVEFLKSYLLFKVIDRYISSRNEGNAYFARFILVNSKRSVNHYADEPKALSQELNQVAQEFDSFKASLE